MRSIVSSISQVCAALVGAAAVIASCSSDRHVESESIDIDWCTELLKPGYALQAGADDAELVKAALQERVSDMKHLMSFGPGRNSEQIRTDIDLRLQMFESLIVVTNDEPTMLRQRMNEAYTNPELVAAATRMQPIYDQCRTSLEPG